MRKPSDVLNQEAFLNPQPGDYWNERMIPYCLVVDKYKDDEKEYLIVLDKIRYHSDHQFSFDIGSPSIYTLPEFERKIKYSSSVGKPNLDPEKSPVFCADVVRTDKTIKIAQEFKEAFPDAHNHPVIKKLVERKGFSKDITPEELLRLDLLNEKINHPDPGTIFYHNHKPFIKVIGYYSHDRTNTHVVYCQQFDNNGFDENHLSIILKETFWKLFQASINEYSIVG